MKRSHKKRSDVFTVPALRDVADFFDVSVAAVKKWRTEGAPGSTAAGWDLRALARWRVSRTRADQDPEMRAARLRLATAAAKSRELENARIEHELVPRDLMERRERERARFFTSILLRIPRDMLPRLEGKSTLLEKQDLADAWLNAEAKCFCSGWKNPDPRQMTDDQLIAANRPKQTFTDWHTLVNALNISGYLQEFQKTGKLPEGVEYVGEFPEFFKKRVAEARAAARDPGLDPRRAGDSEAAGLPRTPAGDEAAEAE